MHRHVIQRKEFLIIVNRSDSSAYNPHRDHHQGGCHIHFISTYIVMLELDIATHVYDYEVDHVGNG